MNNGIQVGLAITVLAAVVGAGLYFVRPDADLDGPAARLESELKRAQEWGFVLTSDELNEAIPPASQNAAADIEQLVALNETDSKLGARISDLRRSAQGPTTISKAKLEPFAHQLEAIDKACAFPDVGFERDWDLGLTLTFDQVSSYRVGARLLATRAEIRAADGDFKGAYEDLARIDKLAQFASKEPVIVGAMSASAIRVLRYQTIRRIAILDKDDRGRLVELRDLIGDELPPPPIAEIGMREAYSVLSLVRNFREFGGPAAFVTETNERSQVRAPSDPSRLKRSGLPDGKFERANLATTLMYWNDLISRINEPGLDPLTLKKHLDAAAIKVKSDRSRARSIIREVMLPANAYLQVYNAEALRRLTTVFLDAFIYRVDHGRFPEAPVQAMRDPFSSRDLRYRSTGDTIKIWSSGNDLMDNNGTRRNGQAGFDEVIEYPPAGPAPQAPMQGPTRPAF
ncbi:MAG: hypothetical protein K1X67_17280 [Fimbriimonadaceae bacterium]|nr:hypothetical protein [Fimbriimonadaceae bacterium]